MKRSCLWITALLLGSVSLLAETPTIPDTPAGHTLKAWLEAFNSGERSRIETWLTKYEPDKPLDPTIGSASRPADSTYSESIVASHRNSSFG